MQNTDNYRLKEKLSPQIAILEKNFLISVNMGKYDATVDGIDLCSSLELNQRIDRHIAGVNQNGKPI